jgi:hypothetical protein
MEYYTFNHETKSGISISVRLPEDVVNGSVSVQSVASGDDIAFFMEAPTLPSQRMSLFTVKREDAVKTRVEFFLWLDECRVLMQPKSLEAVEATQSGAVKKPLVWRSKLRGIGRDIAVSAIGAAIAIVFLSYLPSEKEADLCEGSACSLSSTTVRPQAAPSGSMSAGDFLKRP